MFAQDPNAQAIAAQALKHLIEPILYPNKFQISESATGGLSYDDDQDLPEFMGSRTVRLVDRLDPDAISVMAEAAFALGVLHSTGILPSVPKDDVQAATLYAIAARHNSISGHLAMAHRYEQGFGVPKSCSLSYHHLKVLSDILCS